MNLIKLRPQPLTDETFAPYGRVISGSMQDKPDFVKESGTTGWRLRLEIAKPLYMTIRTPPGTLTVTRLERHSNVTQTFVPLGGGAAALVVAKSARKDQLPKPEDAAAFLLDGSVGYALHFGTWHSLDRFPVSGTSTTWFAITDSDTQTDLANLQRGTSLYTEVIDLAATWGAFVEIDP
jgi:ureidoglycolate lyase